jgi:predicted RND superfamily exporter protein
VRGTFPGAVTSAFTNAAAFLVLVFAKFHAFRQFGLIAAVGVMMSVLAAYALGPAIMAICERFFRRAGQTRLVRPARALRRLPTGVVGGIAGLVLAFAAFSAFALPKLHFETDMGKLKGRSPSSELSDHVTQSLGVQINPAVILVDDLAAARKVTDLVASLRARHAGATAFGDVASLNELLPSDLPARQKEIAALGRLLERQVPASERDNPDLAQLRRMVEAKPWTRSELPLEVRRRFEALDGQGEFVLLFPGLNLSDARNLEIWAAQIGELVAAADKRGVNLAVLDGNLIAGRIFTLVKSDGPRILLLAGVVVFLVIVAGVRSLRKALLIAGPLYLGMLCLAGAMQLFGVHLNFINCVVLPNVLVIAVDNAVHLHHRYHEEGPGSLGRVLRHTGLAAVVATIANAAGYASLLVAHHQGLRSIGYLAAFGVFCTFLGTTVFFPAMMSLIERARGATLAAPPRARHPSLAA